MRAVRFKVSGDLLREALHVPGTATFIDACRDWSPGLGDSIEFTVWDDSLPDVAEPPEVNPSLTRHAAVPERFEWHWNLP